MSSLGGSRIEVSRDEAEAIIRAAWSGGVRYVDTAPYYGFGQAERCVGDALREEARDKWVLSTKVGRLLRPRGERRAAPNRPILRAPGMAPTWTSASAYRLGMRSA